MSGANRVYEKKTDIKSEIAEELDFLKCDVRFRWATER